MAIERLTIPVGQGFDSENSEHLGVVQKKLADSGHGAGWEVQQYDPSTGKLTMSRRSALTKVTREDRGAHGQSYRVELRRGIRPSDGEKIAAELESDPSHAGHYMTSFDPYLAQATLTKLTDDELRTRGAVATALRVKPWDVQVKARRGGGFTVALPGSYVPSQHDKKLEEVASGIVGKPGWYWVSDASSSTGQIIPGELPTFEPVYPFDFSSLPKANLTRDDDLWDIPIGMSLGGRGKPNAPLQVDFKDSVGSLLVGLAGAGKATPLDSRIPVPISLRFPDGWATMGELRAGDQVYSATGDAVRVTSFSETHDERLYVVHLSDGRTVRAAGTHLWTVTDITRVREETRLAPDESWAGIARALAREVPSGVSATLSDISGLLADRAAGEGASLGVLPDITRLPLSNLGQAGLLYPVAEVCALLAAELDPLHPQKPGLNVVTTTELAECPWRYSVPLGGYTRPDAEDDHRETSEARALADAAQYLRAGLRTRLAAVRQLLDLHAVETSEDVFTVSVAGPGAADDFIELVRSVGYYADQENTVSVVVRRGRYSWASVTAVDVLDVKVPMRCLRVDSPEHLYMTDDFVPTHNSVTTQGIIFNALARKWRLALINTRDKATDFAWAKPFVAPHMWGCDSVAQSVTVAKLVIEEGERLGQLLTQHAVSKWQDLPPDVRAENPPLLLVADELAALLTADALPAGLSKEMKEMPEFVQMQQDLLESKLLATSLSKIPALYRAAGIRVLYLTQQPSERYGFSAKLKGNLPHRIMLGTSPSDGEKANAFRTPEKVPSVPPNIATDSKTARGVGLAHLDGKEAEVFKGYFAPLDMYLEAAARMGFPKTHAPEPTAKQIARLVPRVDQDIDEDDVAGSGGASVASTSASSSGEGGFGRGPRKYEPWELDEDGQPLSPAQRANAARAKLAADAKAS